MGSEGENGNRSARISVNIHEFYFILSREK
jgi:hypothetical protein